jgi:ribosomal 30S subunit maturation factor RimM
LPNEGREGLQGKAVWLVKLKGINTPEQAAGLNKHSLLIQSVQRPPLSDQDEFYVQELIGMRVRGLPAFSVGFHFFSNLKHLKTFV